MQQELIFIYGIKFNSELALKLIEFMFEKLGDDDEIIQKFRKKFETLKYQKRLKKFEYAGNPLSFSKKLIKCNLATDFFNKVVLIYGKDDENDENDEKVEEKIVWNPPKLLLNGSNANTFIIGKKLWNSNDIKFDTSAQGLPEKKIGMYHSLKVSRCVRRFRKMFPREWKGEFQEVNYYWVFSGEAY